MKIGKIGAIEIWNRKFYLHSVMSFLDSLVANHKDLEHDRYNRFRYVVSELIRLRIEKAYPGADGLITIEISLAEDYFEVSVIDKGIPYWIDKSNNVDMTETLDERTTRNQLFRYMVDGLGMENLGKDGQRIFARLNVVHRIVFEEPTPYPETQVLDTNITIKPVETKKDALEAIRCIYSEYGYSYAYQKFYYIDSFMKAIESGDIMSFLAVNEHGQTAGHFSLVFSETFKNMPEISTVVTRKEFRGLGLFAMFMDYCMELGEKYKFKAFMGQPVAFHTMSQKAFIKSGFTATSVLLSYVHSEIESEYNRNKQRLDLYAGVKLLDKTAHSVIYPPAELRPFIEKIFKNLGYGYEIGTDFAPAKLTQIGAKTKRLLKTTKILLTKADGSFEGILSDMVKESIHGKNEMIELMISLNDPSCEYAYEITKRNGFSFSGIVPGSEAADYIIMQMLIGGDCHYSQLVAIGDYEELTNDIIAINRGGSVRSE